MNTYKIVNLFCFIHFCLLQLIPCFKLFFSRLLGRFAPIFYFNCEHFFFVCHCKTKTNTKSLKGFNFDNKYFSQNFDDFRKSMQNTYWLSQKAKQLEDDSSKGILGLSQQGGITFFSPPPPPCQGFRKC